MPNTQGYEQHATDYEQWFEDNPATYEAEIKALQQLLPAGKGIEIGAGSGRFTQPLNIHTGIEPAKAMRDISIAKGLNVIEGVAEALPVKDELFDFAIFVTSTCFLDDPFKAYQEAHRVTKNNGAIVVAFLEKNSELGKIYEAHKHENPLFADATFYSYSDITNMLSKAGFGNFKTVQTVLPKSKQHKTTDILPGHDLGTFVVVYADKKD